MSQFKYENEVQAHGLHISELKRLREEKQRDLSSQRSMERDNKRLRQAPNQVKHERDKEREEKTELLRKIKTLKSLNLAKYAGC